MKELPAKFLSDKNRKEMWEEAKKIIGKIDKALDLSQAYVIGSYVSKKKHINDIDFVIVSKVKKKKSNISWPVDFVVLPENEDLKEYLQFFKKYMKRKYGSSSKPIRIK